MAAFNSCLHYSQKKMGQKANLVLNQSHTVDIDIFSFPLTAYITSCPLFQGLSLPTVISDNTSLAVFSDLEFKDLVAKFTVYGECAELSAQFSPASRRWWPGCSAAVSAEYTPWVSNYLSNEAAL